MRDFEAHGLLQEQPEALEEGVQLSSLCVATGDTEPSVTDKAAVLRESSAASPSLCFRVLELLEPSRTRVDSKEGNCN